MMCQFQTDAPALVISKITDLHETAGLQTSELLTSQQIYMYISVVPTFYHGLQDAIFVYL